MHKEAPDMARTELFDALDTPTLDLLISKSGDDTTVEGLAVFDSSFDKGMSVPAALAEFLGLTPLGWVSDEGANSSAPQRIVAEANVVLLDEGKMVPVVIGARSGPVVIGPDFLKRFNARLIVDRFGTSLVDDAEWRRYQKALADWLVEPSDAPALPSISQGLEE